MKNFWKLVLTIAALASGCIEMSDNGSLDFPPRAANYAKPDKVEEEQEKGENGVYISAVRVPEGYDWRQDTAIGISPDCEIVLLKNLEEILSFKAGYDNGVSTDPDTHHLIDGHLYTEFATVSSTILKRDGLEVLRFDGRCSFLGIYPSDEGLYTLAARRDGTGFQYRKGKDLLIDREDATVFGSFLDTSRPETGALYSTGGKLIFTYKAKVAGHTTYHVVQNGLDTEFSSYMDLSMYDLRVVNGKVYPLCKTGAGGLIIMETGSFSTLCADYVWSEARIHDLDGKIALSGTGRRLIYPTSPLAAIYTEDCISTVEKNGADWYIKDGQNGKLVAVSSKPSDWYIFTPGSVRSFGGEVYCVKSPKDPRMIESLLTVAGNSYPVRINGYLTGVCVVLNNK